MPQYRRRGRGEPWHWCKNCSGYPNNSSDEVLWAEPQYGMMCGECKANVADGTCKA